MQISTETMTKISEVVNAKKLRNKRSDCFVAEERIQKVLDLYASGMSLRSLTKETGMEFYRLKTIIDMAGMPIKNRSEQIKHVFATTDACAKSGVNRRILTPEQLSEMIELHQTEGMRSVELAERYGVSESGILYMLNRVDALVPLPHNFYTLDETYFDDIDTVEKAYFFGLLMADGSTFVGRNGNSPGFRIALIHTDQHILDELNIAIGSNRIIKVVEREGGQPQALLDVRSRHMFDSLVRHGCVPRKTWSAEYPSSLRYDLHPHFIRGYSDGNGCVHIGNVKERVQCAWTICAGSEKIIEGIANHLDQVLGAKKRTISYTMGTYALRYGGNQMCLKALEYVYSCGGPKLERKYDKWLNIRSIIPEQTQSSIDRIAPSVPLDVAEKLYADDMMSTSKIAKIFNTNIDQVRKALRLAGVPLRGRAESLHLTKGKTKKRSCLS